MTDWKDLAARLAGQIGNLSLNEEALAFLKGLPVKQPVLVACSGGADSVFLVLALLAQLESATDRLHILHYNHGLRDEASAADEAFVGELAESLGVPFHRASYNSPVPSNDKSPVPSDEHSLRSARYGWMGQIYDQLGAGALCLGHHADDLLESQLMALLSGSGPAGLAAPLPLKRFTGGQIRLRPLLGLRRRQIEKSLKSVGIPWREDESNSDETYTRNWIRHQLVPNLRVGIPQNIYAASALTQARMQENVDAIDHILKQQSLKLDDPGKLDIAKLSGQPRALLRRAIMAWWMRHNPEFALEAAVIERVMYSFASENPSACYSIGGGRVLSLSEDRCLRILPEKGDPSPVWPAGAEWVWSAGPLCLPDGSSLSAGWVEWDKTAAPEYKQADPATTAWLAGVGSCISVRQWQPGDRYQPLGAPGRRKLQDIFTDAKLAPERKRASPVLIDEEGFILWVPGFPPCEKARIQAGGNSALKLTYHTQ